MIVLEHTQIHIVDSFIRIFCFQTKKKKQELDLASLKLQCVQSNHDFTATPRQESICCWQVMWTLGLGRSGLQHVIKGKVMRRSHEVRVENYANAKFNNEALTLIQSHLLVNITWCNQYFLKGEGTKLLISESGGEMCPVSKTSK